jgi:hypothetical protein
VVEDIENIGLLIFSWALGALISADLDLFGFNLAVAKRPPALPSDEAWRGVCVRG